MNFFQNLISLHSQPAKTTEESEYDPEKYIRENLETKTGESKKLIERYGLDFSRIFYDINFEKNLLEELLPFIRPEEKHKNYFSKDHWVNKNPFNFPGPFYTGESDTCGTGECEAPKNVMCDLDYNEYIFKQPKNYIELLSVTDAAAVEVLDSYSCNGNSHWTYQLVKDWWKDTADRISLLTSPELMQINGSRGILYVNYLRTSAHKDLRKYCFFLENGTCPTGISYLPEL